MKSLLGLAALILVAFSLLADFHWKRWIAARKREREQHDPQGTSGRNGESAEL